MIICGFAPNIEAKRVTVLSKIEKVLVIMGNEGNGISQNVIDISDIKITIPMLKHCESLNVAVATGIISWEMMGRGKK